MRKSVMNAVTSVIDAQPVCDNCEKPCETIYETAEGNYVCLDCHTACPPEDD